MRHIMNTHRLTLSELTLQDVSDTQQDSNSLLHDILSVLSPNVIAHLPPNFQGLTTIKHAKDWLINMLKDSRVFAITGLDDDSLRGFIFIHNSDTHQYHIGYLLAEGYWGKGYAQEALSAFIHWCKSTPSIKELIAGVEKSNLASIAVLTKMGFTFQSEHQNSMLFYTQIL